MRDEIWLENLLEEIYQTHFNDIERINPIHIRFGRKSKYRLGSIFLVDDTISQITVNGHFRDELIPIDVLYETIAHELIHYIHGFNSKLERKLQYPHQGGVIEREMKARGLDAVYLESKSWLKSNWGKVIQLNHPVSRKPRKKRKKTLFQELFKFAENLV